MFRAKDGWSIVAGFTLTVVGFGLVGCRHAVVEPFATYSDTTSSGSPTGSFTVYLQAAQEAEKAAEKHAKRTHFTPGYRIWVLDRIGPAISKVAAASQKPVAFAFEPTESFEPRMARTGWRLIGMGLAWRIEAAVKREDYDAAIADAIVATRFGFDLTQGDCSDATLGFSVVDDARRALLPAIPRLQSKQLGKLSDGFSAALRRVPNLQAAIENERQNMMVAIDQLQNAHRKGELKRYREQMRQDVQPAIGFLEDIDPADPKRAEYFDSLAKEAETIIDHARENGRLNARQRSLAKPISFKGERPWRRWTKYLFAAPDMLFPMRDRTLARTRLVALHCHILRLSKTVGLPPNLSQFPAELVTDPYSGTRFVYSRAGSSYKLYSVGADFRDDGGETDDGFAMPDLKVEAILL